MKIVLLCLLVACGDNVAPEPDAMYANPPPMASTDVVLTDASVDAPECWRYVVFPCDDVIIQSCVPYQGCSESFVCHGQSYAYCHAGDGGL